MEEKKKQILTEEWDRCLKLHKHLSQDMLEDRGAESRMRIKHDRNVIEALMMGYVLGGTDLLLEDNAEDFEDDFTEWLIRCEINPFVGDFQHTLREYYVHRATEQED